QARLLDGGSADVKTPIHAELIFQAAEHIAPLLLNQGHLYLAAGGEGLELRLHGFHVVAPDHDIHAWCCRVSRTRLGIILSHEMPTSCRGEVTMHDELFFIIGPIHNLKLAAKDLAVKVESFPGIAPKTYISGCFNRHGQALSSTDGCRDRWHVFLLASVLKF